MMLLRPSRQALLDLARVSRSMAGQDTEYVQYLTECREELRDELENTQDEARMRQLQGGVQVLSQLLKLCREAPEAASRRE
ncbi:MAG: hypothetical protein R6V05_13315 [Candidatus Brocadiia bacterium]